MNPTRFCTALIASLLAFGAAFAQAPGDHVVDEIAFTGLDRVSDPFIRSQLESKTNEPVSPDAVARDIRRLYALGYFTRIDAELERRGGKVILTFVFEEEKVIDQVRIFGNKKIKTRLIKQALNWQAGDSFYKEGWSDERDAVLAVYAKKGYLNATVDVVVEEIGPARVRVSYFIKERKKARIRELNFAGNEVLSERKLKKAIKTKPRRWLILGGKYDADKFDADLRNVVDEYGNVGHLEAEVTATDFEYRNDGKNLNITIHVSEGSLYHVESMELAGNIVFDDTELDRIVEIRTDDIHNKGQVQADSEALRSLYADSGYINARVAPRVTLDREKKTTHVVHSVREGELKYLREIRITGNSVTRDEVIRRRLVLEPGDRFDGGALRRSQNRIESTRFFDSTRINVQDVPENPVFTDLLIDVDEGNTGSFNFGGGFSTDENFMVFAELRLNNFDITNWPSLSGGGQQFSARVSLGDTRTLYNLSFTDPEIGGLPFSFGVDLFNESFRSRGGSDYRQDTTGAQVRFGKVLSEYVVVRAAFAYRNVDIDGIDEFVNSRFNELLDPDATISTTWSITRDTTDHYRDPTRGGEHTARLTLAGLADNEFVKLGHDNTLYYALDKNKKWVFSQRFRQNVGFEIGDREFIPLQERFFAGGSTTIRGYESRDVGPKELDISGELQAIGGHYRILSNTEVKYKINEIFRLYGFFDGGGVFLKPGDFDTGGLRYGAGIGFGIEIPGVGPMRIDYGIPINPDDTQGGGQIHFNTGFTF